MATYITNRIPSIILNWKTPSEMLYLKEPCYDNLKVFGSFCYASNNQPPKDKFDVRAFKCIFLGYNSGQKAYKVYDIQNHRMFMSRDVVFHKTIFPYKPNIHENCQTPLPIIEEEADFEYIQEEEQLGHGNTDHNQAENNEVPLRHSSRDKRKP